MRTYAFVLPVWCVGDVMLHRSHASTHAAPPCHYYSNHHWSSISVSPAEHKCS